MNLEKQVQFIQRALLLAEKGAGYTSPNPMVGAVLVKDGRIIGEGYHPGYGQKHAEVLAIENATEPVEGATLFCNLEPCCHNKPFKNTPPCTQRIIKEKINKVVVSTIDPNPHVDGKGLRELRDAGIEVETGFMAEEAVILNEVYFKYIQSQMPFVHVKIAQSLDGRIATRTGDSRWITDETALQYVHRLRHTYDAVLVGKNTVLKDNPSLTVRLVEGKQPYRLVLDERLEIPPDSHLVQDGHRDKTIIFTGQRHDVSRREYLEKQGIRVLVFEEKNSKLPLKSIMAHLGEWKIASVLVEGGSGIFTSFFRQQLLDKVTVFIAPVFIGKGIEALGDLDTENLKDALRLKKIKIETIGRQAVIQGYRSIEDTFQKMSEVIECLPES